MNGDEISKVIGDLRNDNNRLQLLKIGLTAKDEDKKKEIDKRIAKNIIEIKRLGRQNLSTP